MCLGSLSGKRGNVFGFAFGEEGKCSVGYMTQ